MAKDKDATGCEVFADRITKAAKEQKLTKVCVDLSHTDYSEDFGNMFVPALSERGIDVLVYEENSKNCLNDFKNKGKKDIRGLHKDGSNDVWFLPGTDLSVPENKTATDNKAKALLDKENAMLQQIQGDANADIKLSGEMLSAATVKEIFDALEKNQTDGTLTLPWCKDHPLENKLLAWARTYCSSDEKDGRPLMKRYIKLVPEKVDDKDFFPETFKQNIMTNLSRSVQCITFGCLCDSEKETVTFVGRADWLDGEKSKMLVRIAENGQIAIREYDWETARFFFKDLVAKKMGKAYGGFYFCVDPKIEEMLSDIGSYADRPRAERIEDLEIEFDKKVEISASPVRDFLNKYPECKARISCNTSSGTVDKITLKSRSHYLLDTVKETGKLAFVAADIVGAGDRASLSEVLQNAAKNGLEELIVLEDVLHALCQETFLKAVKDMFSYLPGNGSVKVTSEDPGVINLLLEKLGNDNVRNDFFIKDTATSCHSTSRKQFLKDCCNKLMGEIQNNNDDEKVFKVSEHNLATDKVNDICSCMTQDNRHGYLCLNFNAKTCADAVKHILKEGVKRSWILQCKASLNLQDMVSEMTNGWALNCSPHSKNQHLRSIFPEKRRRCAT